MNAKEFITQQLGACGWAPIDHSMAVLLCPDAANSHRDFAVDGRNPENLTKVFPDTRLYQAQVEGIGVVPLLSRSSLILAERMAFLGFVVTSVTEFNARAPAARPVAKREPRTVDLIALQHAGVTTKEAHRTCNQCGRLSSAGTCLAAILGEVEGAPMDYRPAVREPRRCLAYAPPHLNRDSRTGRELWPEIATQSDKRNLAEGDMLAIDIARALITSMLKDGPRDAAEVFAAAERDGLHARTVQRAAESLLVVKTKSQWAGGWTWAMPEKEPASA